MIALVLVLYFRGSEAADNAEATVRCPVASFSAKMVLVTSFNAVVSGMSPKLG